MNTHCLQVETIKALLDGFLSGKFDNMIDLNPKIAEITARHFFKRIIEPRLEKLMETGQKMENGLIIRQAIMAMSKDYVETEDKKGNKIIIPAKGNLEEFYQREKIGLKKALVKDQKKT